MRALMDLRYREGGDAPLDPTLTRLVATRFAYAWNAMPDQGAIAATIRVIVPGRLAGLGFRAPKVLFVVTDECVAVLGGLDWSGFLSYETHELDIVVPWQHLSLVSFQFPASWGGMAKPASDKLGVVDGTYAISIAADGGVSLALVPEKDHQDWLPIVARTTATALERHESSQSDQQPDTERLLKGMMRYFSDLQGSTPDTRVIISSGLVQQENLLPGFLAIVGRTFGFFDFHDCLVEDVEEGTPLLYGVEALSGCSVMKPDWFFIAPRVAVEVEPVAFGDELISMIIEIGGLQLPFVVSAGQDLDAAGKQAVEQNVGKFLGLVDRAILG